jgi:hypothetical protein
MRKKIAIPKMDCPSIYRICVPGSLDAEWSHRVGGMNITESRNPDGGVETVLVGRLPDQAALSGVLNTLYELHLPVSLVECLEANGSGERG